MKESQNKEYYKKNLDKIKESKKEYRKKNLVSINEKKREYYKKNLAKIKESEKEYRRENNDKIKERKKVYRRENRARIKEGKKEYYFKNLDKIKEKKTDYLIRKNPKYIPNYSWKTKEQSRKNFESIASLLHITDLFDWYRISLDQIQQVGGGSIIVKFGSLKNALLYAYPEVPWDDSKFAFRGKKSTQRWLYFKLRELLPNVDIIEDYDHPDLVWGKVNRSMQLDIWVPEHKLALEYQGEHHYYDIHTAYGSGSTSKMFFERDQEKEKLCLEKGISLICVPYWWDRKVESLCSTLHQTHPTLFPKTDSPPIPTSPPNTNSNIEISEELVHD